MSLRVLICDAAKDENGKTGWEGSIPGNQYKMTGEAKYPDEVRTINYEQVREFWWKNRETKVYRLKREDMATALAVRMKQSADNKFVGYSQFGRKTFNEKLMEDPDPSHINTPVECDCSSCLNSCLYVTFKTCNHSETSKVKSLARTIEMPAMFDNINEIENVTDKIDLSTGKGFRRGDILVIPNNHTAIVWEVAEVEDPIPEPSKPIIKQAVVKKKSTLRIGPNADAPTCNIQMARGLEIRDYLNVGETVNIIDEENGFYQLFINGVYAWEPWVSADAIDGKEEEKELYGYPTGTLYLRVGPGIKYQKCNVALAPDYKIRNYLRKGEKVKILEEKDGWYKVECKGEVYTWYPWCSAKYIVLI